MVDRRRRQDDDRDEEEFMNHVTHPDPVVAFVVQWCERELGPLGLQEVWFFGSRASAIHTQASDWDFYAVFADTASPEFSYMGQGHMRAMIELRNAAIKEGVIEAKREIDLFTTLESAFRNACALGNPESHCVKAVKGQKVWPAS